MKFLNFSEIIRILSTIPQRLFLIDGIGALVSASLLLLISKLFPTFFHLPKTIILVLASVAFLFAGYSLFFSKKPFANWPTYLKVIATANIFYCLVTILLVLLYFPELSLKEIAYFFVEVVIVLSLAFIEFKVSLAGAQKTEL